MSIELYITVSLLLGFIVGLAIDRNARRERDQRINDLEQQLTVKQNVMESQNATIGRLRKKLNKKGGLTDE